ncbi:MAG: haloalkane dehalogenase [Nitrosopumilus sp.]|nr:haloalkane dehalogenase [Nitrosopumilus sp.]
MKNIFFFMIITFFAVGIISSPVVFGGNIDSPRKQMAMGTAAEDVLCKAGFDLMLRSSGTAACVKPSTAIKLENSGWGTITKTAAMMTEEMMDDTMEDEMMDDVMINSAISADFPFESHYVEVLGSKMHYIDEGEGDPILFLHGNPTSSYLWRNIIPYVSDNARVIAVDLIGMGKSDKPDIDYRFVDHAKYLEEFIEELELKNVTLVIHDWGSGLGFNYASQHEDNIKGIAFMEAIIMPMKWDEFPAEFREIFENFRTPGVGEEMIMTQNIFVEQMLPGGILRELSEEEMNFYQEPYPTEESRKPVWVWPNEIPIDGEPADLQKIVTDYNQWLQETEIPKILFYVSPGAILPSPMVDWSEANMKNLETLYVGEGMHFIQEDHPDEIGQGLAEWYRGIQSAEKMDDAMETMSIGGIDVTMSAPLEGSPDAPITIIEFGDFQCPKCNQWFQNEKSTIVENHIDTGMAKVYFLDYTWLGDDSTSAAQAAHCAGDQEMYWEYHTHLYNNQGGINEGWASPDNLKTFAEEMGLETEVFNECLDSGKYDERVSHNNMVGASHNVEGTPTFFIIDSDGSVERINGPQPASIFDKVIESLS